MKHPRLMVLLGVVFGLLVGLPAGVRAAQTNFLGSVSILGAASSYQLKVNSDGSINCTTP